MRDKKRIDRICKKLKKLWLTMPNQRLGQLLENYIYGYHLLDGSCMFHIEDKIVEQKLDVMNNKGCNLGNTYNKVQLNHHQKREGFK